MKILAVLNNKLFNKKSLMITILIGISVVCLMKLTTNIVHNKPNIAPLAQLQANQQAALTQLNRIEARISKLSLESDQANNTAFSQEMSALSMQLNTIQSSLMKLNPQADVQQMQAHVLDANHLLFQKLAELQTQLQQIKKQVVPPHYLPISALPFRLVSIDIWNGQPEATVAFDHHSALMAQSDSRSGWTLIDIDFDPARVVFKNQRNQLVKVDL